MPFYLRAPPQLSVTDYYIALNGQRPRFRADWDSFASIQEYEEFCDAWIDEVMRCLNDRGSMFIHGCFTNIDIIGHLLQMKGIWINNQIASGKRNSRPIVCRTRLRHSNESSCRPLRTLSGTALITGTARSSTIRWIRSAHAVSRCWISGTFPRGRVSGIPRQSRSSFLSALLMAGIAGGTVLELFSGAGPAAIAAMRWGMKSISIDREPSYLAMLAQRVNDELALAAD